MFTSFGIIVIVRVQNSKEDAVTAAIRAALGESEESRRAETAMLVDLEAWLARVASLPGELMEMEIDNTLAERMDGMANATVKRLLRLHDWVLGFFSERMSGGKIPLSIVLSFLSFYVCFFLLIHM